MLPPCQAHRQQRDDNGGSNAGLRVIARVYPGDDTIDCVSERGVRSAKDGGAREEQGSSIDELLDEAVAAINRGDLAAATALAGQVLAVDEGNIDAEDLLAAPGDGGEIRRLTIFFADLVDSTALSTQVEPETYRTVVGRYRELVVRIVAGYEGHIASTKGDGLLAVFGHPIAHDDDVRRAVQAGLDISREVSRLSAQAKQRFGIEISVRVGVHRGLVYLDTTQDDVYGLAANLAARVSGLAPPGTVVVSDPVATLIRNNFELETQASAPVKGIAEPIAYYRVVCELAPAPPVSLGRTVGRDLELSQLETCWAQAQSGTLTPPGVVFRGEAGIGKSHLAAAVGELVRRDDGVVLELVGSPFHTGAGLHPVRTLLERRCGIDRSTEQPERLRLLDRELRAHELEAQTSIALLAPVLGIRAEVGYEPVAVQGHKLYELIADAVRDYLLACLRNGPGLVVAEDMHWFDPSTIEVLGSLLDSANGALMVVATGRPGEWLPSGWPTKAFDLTPLTDEQTGDLISALDPALSAQDRAAVVRRCDGVPFYIEEVVAGLSKTGVPETLYELLFARLRTSPDVMPVVEAAAIIGREIDRDLLCSVVGQGDEAIDAALDELKDARVLEPCGTDNWRFRHELLREVAAELSPPTVRRGLHAKIADALAGVGEPDWRLVAGHYEQAERFDEAASAYQRASTEARRRGALAEARTYLSQSLAQLGYSTPGANRDRRERAARLERGLLTSAAEGYQSRAAAVDFERCLQLAGTDLRDDELFAALVALLGYYTVRADLRRLAQLIESLGAGLGHGRQWRRPLLEEALGVLAFRRGEFRDARRHLERAVIGLAPADQHKIDALWRNLTDPWTHAGMHLGLASLFRGDLDGAATLLAQAAQRAEGQAFPRGPYSLTFTRSLQSWMHMEAGQLDRAAARAAEVSELADRHGFDQWRLEADTWAEAVSGLAALAATDHSETAFAAHIDNLSTRLDTLRTLEINRFSTFYDAVLARLLTVAGRPEAARARLDTALQLARDTELHFYDAELLRLRAHVQHDPTAREADVDAAIQLARRQGATLFELRAALDDHELRGEPARSALMSVVTRMPTDSALPEMARARDALGLTDPAPEAGRPLIQRPHLNRRY
jgi:class 3 adenylate cyclase/tetratricopeptide (TPR) repeat protein